MSTSSIGQGVLKIGMGIDDLPYKMEQLSRLVGALFLSMGLYAIIGSCCIRYKLSPLAFYCAILANMGHSCHPPNVAWELMTPPVVLSSGLVLVSRLALSSVNGRVLLARCH